MTRSQGAQAGLSTPASSSCSGAQTQLEGATWTRATLPTQLGPAPGLLKKELRKLLLSLVLNAHPLSKNTSEIPHLRGSVLEPGAQKQP